MEKLFKMLREDELIIRIGVLELFLELDESYEQRVKFWMRNDIVQHYEILLLMTDKKNQIKDICLYLACLIDIAELSLVSGSNLVKMRIHNSAIPKRLEELRNLELDEIDEVIEMIEWLIVSLFYIISMKMAFLTIFLWWFTDSRI